MPKMIQVRNVPEAVHRRLKAKAALAGKSLSEYLLEVMTEYAQALTPDEIAERLRRMPPVAPGMSSAELVRAERDSR